MSYDIENLIIKLIEDRVVSFNEISGEYIILPTEKKLKKSLGFNDISIVQKKNICPSRLNVDTKSEVIKEIWLELPLISANMSTVTNADFCIKMHKYGGMGILHRASPKNEILTSIKKISEEIPLVAASIGVSNNDKDFFKEMIQAGCNIICIDIAHGYSDSVINMAKNIKQYSKDTKVIVGNTVNIGLLLESHKFVDAVKVGIGQGLACTTKDTAGCTEKQFSAVYKFKELSKELGIPVISDGSIKEPSDFSKAIGAGANSVMAGSIFARCPESAAETVEVDGNIFKVYAGMASKHVQETWKGSLKQGTCAEGAVKLLPLGESVENLMVRYSGALKSGITYGGGKDIESFQKECEFIKV
jgi:IMP dehydrogenase